MLQYKYIIRNVLALLLGASTLFSCENTIDLNDEDYTPRLALTYLGSTEGEAQQRVYISETYISRNPRLIKDAKLEVFVNDELKETITSSTFIKRSNLGGVHYITTESEKKRPERNAYLITKQFKAGDKVLFRASHPNYPSPAEAEVIVPKAPKFDVKTKEITKLIKTSGSHYKKELLKFTIKVQDIKNENNYYRLKIHYANSSGEVFETPRIDNKEDYIMMKGEPRTDNEDLEIGISGDYKNNYNVFSDELFRDKEGTITVYCSVPHRDCKVLVSIEGINATLYRYLQVIDNTDYNNPLVTPTILPTNVKGGVGVISIANSKTETSDYKAKPLPNKPFFGL